MELLSDSEYERLRQLRKLVASQTVRECASPAMLVYLRDLAFVLEKYDEAERERWSYYHG